MTRHVPADHVGRRSFLVGGLAAAAAYHVLGLEPPPAVPDGPPFGHGVASGDPLPDAVVIWTRLTTDRPARVFWQVALDEEFGHVVRSGRFDTDERRDHTVKVDVTGLQPATTYWYRFSHGTDVSPIGRTRTAPAADDSPEQYVIGLVSCANWQAGWFGAYRHLAERDDLDLVVHLGDYLYEYQPGKYSYGHDNEDVRRHDPPWETVTLDDYRRRHAQYKTDPDLQALHAKVPFVVTWDDHEVCDGWWPGGAFEHQANEGSFAARRKAAQRAYDEWMPVRLSGTADLDDGYRMYRDLRIGGLAHLAMLDLRGYRDERVDDGDARVSDRRRTLTGADQRAWLLDTLDTTSARWKLIGNPVMVSPVRTPPRPTGAWEVVSQLVDLVPEDATEHNTDTWDGYRADRDRVLDHLAEQRVDDVLFLSGDVHTSWMCDVRAGDGSLVAHEVVCPSVTSNNVDDFVGYKPRTVSLAVEGAIVEANPDVRWVNLDDHGWCVLDLTARRARIDWWAIADRRDPDSGASRIFSWEVRSRTGDRDRALA